VKALAVFDKYLTKDLLTSIVSNALALVVAVVLAYAVHNFINWLCEKLRKKSNQVI